MTAGKEEVFFQEKQGKEFLRNYPDGSRAEALILSIGEETRGGGND